MAEIHHQIKAFGPANLTSKNRAVGGVVLRPFAGHCEYCQFRVKLGRSLTHEKANGKLRNAVSNKGRDGCPCDASEIWRSLGKPDAQPGKRFRGRGAQLASKRAIGY
ncbi:hypothetical protein [Bradyrhizobium sp. Ash2021]|uniref:hypothetical protein n=1 Tax=Bradyrhizobium sp. Ash2021 TaxID=2954771 RepID=UPI002814D6CE|nr:hypothetical protein [Bradyrhizobium sp. Ash2021]WMT79355.1 hypothetical protein NL528_31595 [Bradyrhizobium sp. Ash2021]